MVEGAGHMTFEIAPAFPFDNVYTFISFIPRRLSDVVNSRGPNSCIKTKNYGKYIHCRHIILTIKRTCHNQTVVCREHHAI